MINITLQTLKEAALNSKSEFIKQSLNDKPRMVLSHCLKNKLVKVPRSEIVKELDFLVENNKVDLETDEQVRATMDRCKDGVYKATRFVFKFRRIQVK